jgi:hypothetical protein
MIKEQGVSITHPIPTPKLSIINNTLVIEWVFIMFEKKYFNVTYKSITMSQCEMTKESYLVAYPQSHNLTKILFWGSSGVMFVRLSG